MKIAYTMNGLFGGIKGRNWENDDTSNQLPTISKYLYNSLDKRILENNDVDIFLFTWHHQEGDLIDEIYKPVSSKHTEQVVWNNLPGWLQNNNNRVQAAISRWYGFQQVNELRKEYEKENNFEYDLIVNGRLDHYWEKDIDFNKYDVNYVHTSYLADMAFMQPHPGRGSNQVRSDFFAMNSENMDKMAQMYNYLYAYTEPGQCPQYETISHHYLVYWHFKKMGWVENDIVKYDFPTSLYADRNANPKLVDYIILRLKTDYEGLTIADLEESIK
jgi:hypothetical protein